MKSLSLILNGVLIIAVGMLYYLHFSSGDSKPQVVALKESNSMPAMPLKNIDPKENHIVFVDYDSLMQNYDLYKKIEKELQNKIRATESEVMQKEQKLQKEYEFYQQNQGSMTEQHRATKEQQLMVENQSLIEMKEKSGQLLAQQQKELNDKLLVNLYGYFDKLGKQNEFSYILTYKKGEPGLVYGNGSLNITKQIVEGLNQEYREKNKK